MINAVSIFFCKHYEESKPVISLYIFSHPDKFLNFLYNFLPYLKV